MAVSPEPFEVGETASPRAAAMIQSLRAFGYDLTTAVADLLDNSISAKSKTLDLTFFWDGSSSWVAIRDDGSGMTETQLVEAMRPGSRNPLETRDSRDLGRFGLGLKTASFSQCRKLTVITKSKGYPLAARSWDLDYVTQCGEWRLIKSLTAVASTLAGELGSQSEGTIVLWEKMDRIVGDASVEDDKAHRHFLDKVDQVKRHLAMVFHRFMEGPDRLSIRINGREVEPWDPFLTKEPATQVLATEPLMYDHRSFLAKAYVLPHRSKLDQKTFDRASGIKGWNAHQGFYVYRNKRMLVDGDWLGLPFQKEEHFKLARIQIDIPNDTDQEWDIDVKKSRAKPPRAIRQDLERVARLTRERAVEVYRHRGKVLARQASAEYVFAWQQKVRHGKIHYAINREHPLVSAALDCDSGTRARVSGLLKLLEETVPIPLIALKNAEYPDDQIQPFEDAPAELTVVARLVYESLLKSGMTPEQAVKRLASMEPFNLYPEHIQTLVEDLQGGVAL